MWKEKPLTNFNDLALGEKVLRALNHEGYATPTPIQTKAIPPLLSGRDLLGIAQTGTGKTAAFALPILERLIRTPRPVSKKACRALILSPTRELAGQILASFKAYGRFAKLSADVVYGGIPIARQIRGLANGVDILVATPGRLLDLVQQRAMTLNEVEMLVLDEADHMLDLGFIADIRKLVAMTSQKRQTMLFSATMPKDIAELADAFLRDPVKVEVTPVATTAERVEQQVIFVDTAHKQTLLNRLMDDASIDRALVFTRTKHGADKVVKRLEEKGVKAAAIHGNKSQPQRERALADFKAGRLRLLIATDIAARGIDIDLVSHVINFDLPNMPESYVHRIGRTARAGAAGIAISFCDREEFSYLRAIEKVTRQAIPVQDNPLGEGFGMPPEARVKGAQQPPKPKLTRSGKPVWQHRREEGRKQGQSNRPKSGTAKGSPAGTKETSPSRNASPPAHQAFRPRQERKGGPVAAHGERQNGSRNRRFGR
jgi:ATP-dependent RNA helicase RhlE